ncbi:MAG TPA: alpha/beta hydrolase [Burkholderiaceae bacterium]|nr:alpha/beta hydrolase [Burkholderiaceae bacterium]
MYLIKPQKPAVVLLHSSASSARQWDQLAGMLRPHFHVRAIEFHGHGEQPAWCSEAPLTLADEATLAVSALEEAGGGHVVGHSFGGAVALKLATMYPGLVQSVVAYEPVLFRLVLDDAVDPSLAQEVIAIAGSMREHLANGNSHSAAQVFVDFWSGAGAWNSLPAAKQALIAARMHSVMQHFGALFDEPLQQVDVARLGMPAMLVSGSRTVEVARRIVEVLRAALPAAEHEVLHGMGHMGPITHAVQFNQRLVRFLHAQQGFSTSEVEALSKAA